MRPMLSVFALFAATSIAVAEKAELSFYGGLRTTADSVVSGNDPGGAGDFEFLSSWRDQSSGSPMQYGVRITWWQNQTQGWGIDLNSSALLADDTTLGANGLAALEFSNGINLLTVNTYRKLKKIGDLRPYLGAGIGVSIPRVEFDSGAGRTSQFQLTGPAFQLIAGASYQLNNSVSVFGEYSGSYTLDSADLISGGTLNTVSRNSGLNVGVSLGF